MSDPSGSCVQDARDRPGSCVAGRLGDALTRDRDRVRRIRAFRTLEANRPGLGAAPYTLSITTTIPCHDADAHRAERVAPADAARLIHRRRDQAGTARTRGCPRRSRRRGGLRAGHRPGIRARAAARACAAEGLVQARSRSIWSIEAGGTRPCGWRSRAHAHDARGATPATAPRRCARGLRAMSPDSACSEAISTAHAVVDPGRVAGGHRAVGSATVSVQLAPAPRGRVRRGCSSR